MNESRVKVSKITENKFQLLAGMTRDPRVLLISKELEYYSDPGENFLGIVLLDLEDKDFVGMVIARNENRKFCCVDTKVSIDTIDQAREWVRRSIAWHTVNENPIQPQGETKRPQLDLFKSVVPEEKYHPYFHLLTTLPAYAGAKRAISEMMSHFTDVDGNFVEQFQTTGFDARIWELYIFAILKEANFALDHSHNRPDFLASLYGYDIAIEATIAGRKNEDTIDLINMPSKSPTQSEIEEKLKNEMPIRFGSPLYSKLKKKYWKLEHMKGKPLIFAIADFHNNYSMLWSESALTSYLYGFRSELEVDSDGRLRKKETRVDSHVFGNKEIPSNFFSQPDTEHISAVLTSSSGTLSKFNRMGRQAGYGDPNTTMIRFGTRYNHDEDALTPKAFRYEVDEESKETWGNGVNIFHNPNALIRKRHRMPLLRESS